MECKWHPNAMHSAYLHVGLGRVLGVLCQSLPGCRGGLPDFQLLDKHTVREPHGALAYVWHCEGTCRNEVSGKFIEQMH